MFLNII